ncbi:hypothetical protein ABZ912_53420 [Nonomuraea angiospora]|uniref:hypothetical protein n=1 Tax=Nonomuraea angiospora TaxID=46172 RepID=UPI0033EDA8A8
MKPPGQGTAGRAGTVNCLSLHSSAFDVAERHPQPTGHIVLSLLAFAADTAADARAFAEQLGPEEREAVRRLLDRRGTTATAPDRHTKLYPNYLERIAPEDRDLILPSLMNTLALVGTRDDLRARITTLEQAGIDELLIQPVIDPPTEMAQLAKLLT